MKFLCVTCDEPMKLLETAPPDRGSISLLYGCPTCDHKIAMLTNPFETQLVGSLGVKVGPDKKEGEDPLEGCPFSGMVREMQAEAAAPEGGSVAWTPEARARLDKIPEFVRPMAVAGIEKYATERGHSQVDEAILDQARDFFGM